MHVIHPDACNRSRVSDPRRLDEVQAEARTQPSPLGGGPLRHISDDLAHDPRVWNR